MKTIEQSVAFKGVTPEALFEIYMQPEKHAKAIGAPVRLVPRVGGELEAFGPDKVRGTILEIEPGRRIVQSWRAQPWTESDPDSTLTLTFVETHEGARIELVQTGVPDDAAGIIDAGWHEMYWKPWRAYLNEKE